MRKMIAATILFAVVTINISFGQETISRDTLQKTYDTSAMFKKQISKAQLAAGGILLGGGVGMITGGILQGQNSKNAEIIEDTPMTTSGLGSGKGLIIAGSMTSIIGAILLKKGLDTRREFRNKKGDVVADIGLPENGNLGVFVKF